MHTSKYGFLFLEGDTNNTHSFIILQYYLFLIFGNLISYKQNPNVFQINNYPENSFIQMFMKTSFKYIICSNISTA